MGPFVPDLISDQLNLVVALLLGIGFGFVLEQAGFSSSRRLAGVFYGYDFTVVRVFFTAAVTAMSGIALFGYFGWLDVKAIFINPMWVQPAIVGGIIMGVGFIVGGYCPGTSICAAAIGKIDAMFFVLGGVAGVFGFAELYPNFMNFFDSTALGSIRVYDSLGISQGAFALILIVVAVGMFYATTLIEKKVNKTAAPSLSFPVKSHFIAGSFAILLALVLFLLPDRETRLIAKATQQSTIDQSARIVPPDELAFWILDRETNFQIIDLRLEENFKALALPNSRNLKLGDLLGKESRDAFASKYLRKVLVADTENEERIALSLMKDLGYENLSLLEGGLPSFQQTILEHSSTGLDGSRWDADVVRFRTEARADILKQIETAKQAPAAPVKKAKAVKGGC